MRVGWTSFPPTCRPPSTMLRRQTTTLAPSFGQKFNQRTSPISSVDVKVEVSPRKSKKNKFSFSDFSKNNGSQQFWEELRDSSEGRSAVQKSTPRGRQSAQSESEAVMTEDDLVPSVSSHHLPAVQTPVITESTLPVLNNPIERFMEPNQSFLAMQPDRLAAQQEIMRAKQSGDVLVMVDSNRGKLDAVNLATAFHRLAKVAPKKGATHVSVVKSDVRFERLLESLSDTLREGNVGQVWMSNVLWSIVKLEVDVGWLPDLLRAMIQNHPESMPLEQIGCNLYSIAELERRKLARDQDVAELKEILIQTAVARRDEISNPHQLVSICTSLARLGRAERAIFTSLSDSVIQRIDDMSMGDISSVLWSFTTLKIVDSILFTKIQQILEAGRVSECSKRNIVDICWALSKGRSSGSDDSLSEVFKFTIAPVVRSHMMDYTVRELCTLVWSYATAEVVEHDFYNDLSHALLPKTDMMNAHDVSSVVWALSSVHYQHSDLFGSLKCQALRLKSQFSPLQLSRVIYGLGAGNVKDKHVLIELVNLAAKKMHLLYTQNIVEILIGLNYAGMVTEATTGPFWTVLGSQVGSVSGRDAVQLLSILGSYPEIARHHPELLSSLEAIIVSRFNCSGRWIPSGYDVVDLVQGIADLRISNLELIERVLIHLSTAYKSPSFTPDLFLRFLHGLASFPPSPSPQMALVKKLLLLKEKGIQTAVEKLSTDLISRSGALHAQGAIDILSLYARIGYVDDSMMRLAQAVADDVDVKSLPPTQLVALLSALGQIQILPEFTFAAVDGITESQLAALDGNGLIDLVWTRLALADCPSAVDPAILSRIGEWYSTSSAMPQNLFRAKQIVR